MIKLCLRQFSISKSFPIALLRGFSNEVREIKYEQGQLVQNSKIREYFYYLDHQGQLFLDDMKIKNFTSCYKEQKFLEFFFKNLRANETDRYAAHFPYISYCGRERNYLRCDDLPLVVTQLKEKIDLIQINQIHSAHWMLKFQPDNLYHNPTTGRLYYHIENMEVCHEGEANGGRFKHFQSLPCKIALVKSEISINLLKSMQVVSNQSGQDVYKFEYKSKEFVINSDEGHPVGRLVKKLSQFK